MISSLLLVLASVGAPERSLEPIPIERVKLGHEFFVTRLQANTRVTIPQCLAMCEQTGRLANFALAAGSAKGDHKGGPGADADVYRTLEAIGWTLVSVKVPDLEARADAIVDAVVAAQKPDGYLNTYVQATPGKEAWKDLAAGQELASAGYLIEAGIAYARGTGKTKLLDAAVKCAGLIDATFGPGKRQDVCGYPEIELALAKLGEHTKDAKWVALAKFFVDQRGNAARAARLGDVAQDHAPIREQKTLVGRGLGACQLYAGAAEVAMLAPDATLVEPLKALFADAWDTRTFLTGGLGVAQQDGVVVKPNALDGAGSYCDTCAGLALATWAQRMLILTGESKYGDAVERVLYNHAAAVANVAGDAFLGGQTLVSDGTVARKSAAEAPCCATNLARFWPQVPGMIFAQNGNTLYQMQLAAAEVDVRLADSQVNVRMTSEFPNTGRSAAVVTADKPGTWNVKLRKPTWTTDVKVKHDMKEQEHDLYEHEQGAGWVPFERGYETTDGFMIHFLAPVRRVRMGEGSAANAGRVLLSRGPLVYCVEGVDNGNAARSTVLAASDELKVENVGTILGGTRVIRARAKRMTAGADGVAAPKVATMTAVPYYLWANRAAGDMTVWIAETADKAQ